MWNVKTYVLHDGFVSIEAKNLTVTRAVSRGLSCIAINVRKLQISNSTCRDQLLQLFRAPKREILDRFSNASTEENVMDIGRPPLSVHQ